MVKFNKSNERFIVFRTEFLFDDKLSPLEAIVLSRMMGFNKYYESEDRCAAVLNKSARQIRRIRQNLKKKGYISYNGSYWEVLKKSD